MGKMKPGSKGISLISFALTFVFIISAILMIYVVMKTLSFISSLSKYTGIDPLSVEISYTKGNSRIVSGVVFIKTAEREFDFAEWDEVKRLFSTPFIRGIGTAEIIADLGSDGFGIDAYRIGSEVYRTYISSKDLSVVEERVMYVEAYDYTEEIIIPVEEAVVIRIGGRE